MALSRLYFITMDDAPARPLEQIEAACEAGVRLIQLRMKETSDEVVLRTALAAKEICKRWGSRLIINDRVNVAEAVGADGAHVGKGDMTVCEARRLLGRDKLIGGTANTVEDIREHYLGGADYIGLGPYRHTTTKKSLSPILGLEGYRQVMRALEAERIAIPVMAIGGIGVEDVGPLIEVGVYGVAFSGMLVNAADQGAMVNALEAEIFKTNQLC
jgi:thiamine-phosphate pyrophosphorylase